MKHLTLPRTYMPKCTIGSMEYEGERLVYILERPWKDNAPNISCIPEDTYLCKRVQSPKFSKLCKKLLGYGDGSLFQIMDVPDRDHILIHWGSFVSDTHGCQLTGSEIADIDNDGVLDMSSSRKAFIKFMNFLKDDFEFILTIKEN